MTITLFNSTAEENRLNKTNYLTRIITMDGTLRERCSLLTPSIMIELDVESLQLSILKKIYVVDDDSIYTTDGSNKLIYDLISEILTTNYVYITEFQRYYFVTDIISENRNLWRINMRCDVLMSYYGEILSTECFVARNENTYDEYIQDNLTNFVYDKEIAYDTPTNLDTVTTFTTKPALTDVNVVVTFLTDSTPYYSSSCPVYESLPIITSYGSGGNMSTQYMTMGGGALNDLAKTVYSKDTLLSYIKNVMIYPYSVTAISDAGVSTVKIGSTSYTLTDTFKYPQYYPERVTIAYFKMNSASSFMDYSPYTRYYFYLPYYGEVELSGEAILDKTLKVFYLVNYEDYTSNVYVYNVTDNKVIFSDQCSLGVKVSLSSTNSLEISNQKTALNLNTAINLVGSVLSVAGGASTGNVVAAAGGVLRGASAVGSAISTYNQLYDLGKIGINSGVVGLSNIQTFYIKTVKSTPKGYDSNYFTLHGRPLNKYETLSNLTGFTVVGSVHLENFGNATTTELNQIESLLKDGIII